MSKAAAITEESRRVILEVAYNLASRPDASRLLTQDNIAKFSGYSVSSVRKVLGSINNFRKSKGVPTLSENVKDCRRDEIMSAALKVASRPGGWATLTREYVSSEARCASGLVSKYFGTMLQFRRSIMRAAIERKNLSIIAQGVASNYPHAYKASPELRKQALDSLSL